VTIVLEVVKCEETKRETSQAVRDQITKREIVLIGVVLLTLKNNKQS
jgi:hypothetical protein